MRRIYIAAPLKAASMAYGLANELRKKHEVVSTWHDTVETTEDPTDADTREDVWYDNMRDLSKADVVVFLWPDFAQPRSALVEVGIALERGLYVIWWGNKCLAEASTGVSYVDSYHDLEKAL